MLDSSFSIVLAFEDVVSYPEILMYLFYLSFRIIM
jgi:hypothetical protein